MLRETQQDQSLWISRGAAERAAAAPEAMSVQMEARMQEAGSGDPDDQEWLIVVIQLLIALLDLLKGIGPS
ncbi:hypothetical protein [Nonomuraea sp. NPDC050643]|uniref:hypothetical protein n=1 Tax=Nonomuraea sp. NPDC050643 TaxID=3155660 RepID=UPI0033F070EB